jgi:hypothetical protein
MREFLFTLLPNLQCELSDIELLLAATDLAG